MISGSGSGSGSDFAVLGFDHMDGSQGSSGAPAPFLLKTYELVDDPQTDQIVSWSQNGCSFVVWNQTDFAKDLLPMYFKHNNFSSFVRQLNTYGFRKIDPDQWEFANEDFIRGQGHLLKNIHRRKPIHSHSAPASSGQASPAMTDAERREYEREIARLRRGESALRAALQRHEGERREFERQAQALSERLHGAERRQARLTASLAELARSPGLASALAHQPDAGGKKRRLLSLTNFSDEPDSGLDRVASLESSLDLLERFLYGAAEDFIARMFAPVSPLMATEIDDVDMNCRSGSAGSRLSSPSSFPGCLEIDHAGPKSPAIDVNSSPVAAPEASKERDLEIVTKVNDLFWEQCLTETPGESETAGKDWRRVSNTIESLTTQIEHLTPAMY